MYGHNSFALRRKSQRRGLEPERKPVPWLALFYRTTAMQAAELRQYQWQAPPHALAKVAAVLCMHLWEPTDNLDPLLGKQRHSALRLYIADLVVRSKGSTLAVLLAMHLTRGLKRRMPLIQSKPLSSVRVFTTAFMIASKIVDGNPTCKEHYSLWARLSHDMFHPRELSQMELGLLSAFHYDIRPDPAELKQLVKAANRVL